MWESRAHPKLSGGCPAARPLSGHSIGQSSAVLQRQGFEGPGLGVRQVLLFIQPLRRLLVTLPVAVALVVVVVAVAVVVVVVVARSNSNQSNAKKVNQKKGGYALLGPEGTRY